jgi:sigma-B regulation protein RsbU (phosphoserine phosphatase)
MSTEFDYRKQEHVSLRAICEGAVEEAALDFPERPIHLERSDDARGLWDRDQLEDLVHELIWSAIIQSSPTAPISVSVMDCADEALMVVAYGGEQVPDHVRKHLLDPEHRDFEPSECPALCRSLEAIRALGGRLDLSSGRDEATFNVWLPKEGERAEPIALRVVSRGAS